MTDMHFGEWQGWPIDVSQEGHHVIRRGAPSIRQSRARRQQRRLIIIASSLTALGAAALLAPDMKTAYQASPDHHDHAAKKVVARKYHPKTVIKISYQEISVSVQPTDKDKLNFLNSIDRIMSDREMMQDTLDISAITGSDPLADMLTGAFETRGDKKQFAHTVYHRDGHDIVHSARGFYQIMPDQFVALARQNGLKYARELRLYAAALTDRNRQIFIMQQADRLQNLSTYLRHSPYKTYKDLIAYDPVAKRLLNKTPSAFSGSQFIDRLLQNASNMHDVRILNKRTEENFHLSYDQALQLIGAHIEEHLVNFAGPAMGWKMIKLRGEGKGSLPMFPNIFPKKYMAEQNNAYCEKTKITTVSVITKVRVSASAVLPPAKKSDPHHHNKTHPAAGKSQAFGSTKPHGSPSRAAQATPHHAATIAHAHDKTPSKHSTKKAAQATPHHAATKARAHDKTPPKHPTKKAAPHEGKNHGKTSPKNHAVATHSNPDQKHHASPHHTSAHAPKSTTQHHPQNHQTKPPTSPATPKAAHPAHAVALAAHHPDKKHATAPIRYEHVTTLYPEKSCVVLMSIDHFYDKLMLKYENMFPDLDHKVQTEIAGVPMIAEQFEAARRHRALFIAALEGRITLPKVAWTTPTHKRSGALPQKPAAVSWYQAAKDFAYNMLGLPHAQQPKQPQQKPSGFWASLTLGS